MVVSFRFEGRTVKWAVVRVLLTAIMLGAAGGVRCERVADLYRAQVPVADQGPQAITEGARQALADVLLKVTGGSQVLDDPAVAGAMREARDHVQQYAFERMGENGDSLSAWFEFDEDFVISLVLQSGAPLWTANRPAILVWLVLQDGQFRHFVNGDTEPELTATLLAEFKRRGLPVQLPLYDLADAAALSPEQAWHMAAGDVQTASARYRLRHLLVGRVARLGSGELVGDWSYYSAETRADRTVSATGADDFVRQGAALAAQQLSARYAVASSQRRANGVIVTISGVATYADYAAIVRWLEKLEVVRHADVERVTRDRIALRLDTVADAAQLVPIIELNHRLQRLSYHTSSELEYQWLN